jgi:hypothetical protein
MRKDLQQRPFSEQIATLQQQRLLAAALDHARRQGQTLAPVEQGLWDSLVTGQAAMVERDNALLTRLLPALAASGCPALLLKGAALGRWLYAMPELRPVTDIDLIVAPDKRLDAHKVLVELGCLSDGYSQHDLIANQARYRDRATGRDVDLHWALHVLPEVACRFDFDELMARSISLPAIPNGRALSRLDALMHSVVHYQAHQPPADRPLIWLYDLALLARGLGTAEWAALDRAVRVKQIAGLHAQALQEARRCFDLELPADLIDAWQLLGQRECSRNLINASRGHVARVGRSLACLPTMKQRTKYLLTCVFPSRDWMRGRYAATTGTQVLQAYLTRWFSGAKQSVSHSVPADAPAERAPALRGQP